MITAAGYARAKARGKRFAMLTAYDTPTAEVLDAAGLDFVLVGDSLATVVLGYGSTADVTMDEMIHHAKAVRRGVKHAVLLADMPFKGVEKGPRQALASAKRFMKEAGCDGVKVEWGKRALETTKLLVKNRIPVMGHVGLTPQTAAKTGGFKVRGAAAGEAAKIYRAALAFEKAGAFSVLLECVPSPVASAVTRALKVPTIGIGAGADCDGQVLVFQDLVGTFTKFKPRFVKRYAELAPRLAKAAADFRADVAKKRFPRAEHGFSMKPAELEAFLARLANEE